MFWLPEIAELWTSMRAFILSVLLVFTISVSAKKAPKWKNDNFKMTSSGLRYKIVKEGKGDSIDANDSVVVEYVLYSGPKVLKKYSYKKMDQGKFYLALDKNLKGAGFKESIMLLKEHGCGYFVIPKNDTSSLSGFYFFYIAKVIHNNAAILPETNPPKDSVNFTITDPNKKYYGDTLFAMMKLVEKPQLVDCGISKVLIAFKFERSYFENGMQHQTLLVFIECPELYGKDYFIAGANYMATCVPLLDDLKSGSRTMNSYSLEKLDRYYGLRVKKM